MKKLFILFALFFSFKILHSSEELPNRLFVFGDIHGNKKHALRLLKLTEAFESLEKGTNEIKWKDAKDLNAKITIIQLGDILDRGDDDIELLKLFDDLRSTAAQFGHELIMVQGNHEWMNASGDFLDTSLKRKNSHHSQLLKSGNEYAKNILSLNKTVFIRDGIIYVHGGLSLDFLMKDLKFDDENVKNLQLAPIEMIEQYNQFQSNYLIKPSIKKALKPILENSLYFSFFNKKEKKDLILSNNDWSPMWYRGYVTEVNKPEKKVCEKLQKVLNIFNAKKMIVAHTPQNSIGTTCDGLLLHTDTGAWSFNANHMIAEINLDKLDQANDWYVIHQ
jgi:hypothetical protein